MQAFLLPECCLFCNTCLTYNPSFDSKSEVVGYVNPSPVVHIVLDLDLESLFILQPKC